MIRKVKSIQTSELNGRDVAHCSILLSKILTRLQQTVYVHCSVFVYFKTKCNCVFSLNSIMSIE